MEYIRNNLFSYTYSALTFCLWLLAAGLIFPLRYGKGKTVLLGLAGTAGFLLFPSLIPLGILRSLVGFAWLALVLWLVLKIRWTGALLLAALELSLVMLAEAITLLQIPSEFYLSPENIGLQFSAYGSEFFICLILLTLMVLIARTTRRRSGAERYPRLTLLFMLFPISQYVAVVGWFRPFYAGENRSDVGYFIFAFLLFLAADVGIAVAINAAAKSARLRAENQFLEERIQAQQEYYTALAANYQDIRKLRHDIDNQIYTIKSLLSDKRLSEAAAFADTLYTSDLFSPRDFPGCENTVVASFLLHRRQELAEKSLRLNLRDVEIPVALGIPDTDIIRAMGNLLDNAEEACEAIPDAEITLSAHVEDAYLIVKTANPFEEQPAEKKRRIPELPRGLGQEVLSQLAEKYDGTYTSERQGQTHQAMLVLKERRGA